jgi:RimJ/RimL family protein N-acetyltransferase
MKTINALVREENIASIKVLEKNGFVEMGKQDKLVRYQKVRM